MGCRSPADGVFVGCGVLVPVIAFLPVVRVKLPGGFRRLLALNQPVFLLVLGDVQEILEHDGVVLGQQFDRHRLLAGAELGPRLGGGEEEAEQEGEQEEADHGGGIEGWVWVRTRPLSLEGEG